MNNHVTHCPVLHQNVWGVSSSLTFSQPRPQWAESNSDAGADELHARHAETREPEDNWYPNAHGLHVQDDPAALEVELPSILLDQFRWAHRQRWAAQPNDTKFYNFQILTRFCRFWNVFYKILFNIDIAPKSILQISEVILIIFKILVIPITFFEAKFILKFDTKSDKTTKN